LFLPGKKDLPTLLTRLAGGKRENIAARLIYQSALKNDPFCLFLLAELGKYLEML
jgi:hypothetical protein